jgi:hypothetical protein
MHNLNMTVAIAAALALAATSAHAGTVTVPHTFVSGTPAKAEDVNANFSAIATAVNGNAADVAALVSSVNAIPAGPQGPAGLAGPQGVSGPAGPAGPQGPSGAVGANGTTGATGPRGQQGWTGATGPQGTPGPVGATGPQGPQGPAGSGGALTVRDSNGLMVGQYASAGAGEFVVMKTASGHPFILPIDSNGFTWWLNPAIGADSNVEFATPNCTGTAYVGGPAGYLNGYTQPIAIVPPGIRAGSMVYVSGSIQSALAVQSILYGSQATDSSYPLLLGQTAPTCISTAYTDIAPFSVAGTFDLSVFVFPLSVQ